MRPYRFTILTKGVRIMSPKYRIVPDKDYVLWQLPCSEGKTGMGYIINAADGRSFVIDGGDADNADLLLNMIREKCGGEVTAWFLTHPHPGHAGALTAILADMPEDIKILKIFYSHVNLEKVERFEPESAPFAALCITLIKGSGIPTVNVHPGDRIKLGRTMIRVFSGGDGEFTEDYLNNTSAVYKFNMYCTSILFLGDIMREATISLLERYKSELNCDMIQMANHGIRSTLSEIYAHATPDVCLWSAPEDILRAGTEAGEIYRETRDLLEALGTVEHYVSGIDGLSEIHISY
ncbi:MAG: MBL fold metallo-hydrolase [Ruminococcaceae bacterium]|nr:MBL fold metallo-hydrolase [Oscillospiraceae bacterium]